MGDVIRDVMRRLSFDITEIDAHLEIGNCDAVHFDGSCHEGLSHDETFGTDNLDHPPPFDLNILAHVSDEVIVSNHAMIQDRVDEELGNENDVFPLRVDEQCQIEHDEVNHDRLNKDTHNGLVMNTSRDFEYDADSSENERCKDDADVMIDEEREIDEAEIEVYLFSLKESNHDFTTIGVVRVWGHVEEEVHLIRSIRLTCKVNLMETNKPDGNKYAFY
nr:hypothetical protein [Tanacetum cinerariifolium]